MQDLEPPTTIEEAIKSVCEFGFDYAQLCAPDCDGINDTWLFQNGEIKGPQDGAPEECSHERWNNKWMDELYAKLPISPVKPNTYYRFTATKEEYEDAKLGKFQCSKNHRNCIDEPGKSVANGPLFTYFVNKPYSFLLKGDIASQRCSDGAPLLEINGNLKLASELMCVEELLFKFYKKNKAVFELTAQNGDVSEIDLFNISLGIWGNYWPGN